MYNSFLLFILSLSFLPDDCISPGYHTSLPLEVHGAGYSDMQMISKNSLKKLMCPTVIVTQITFDLEAFTYYAVNYLCSINNKKYGFFFDCGCEIVKVHCGQITSSCDFKLHPIIHIDRIFFFIFLIDLSTELCTDLYSNGELYGK